MCGRFTLTSDETSLAQTFNLPAIPSRSPRYNIAPTQSIFALVRPSQESLKVRSFRWGLIPSWAKDRTIGAKLINARAETVAEKPSFRDAFRHRRCLVIADGFYEWQKVDGKKQPFYFQMRDYRPFAFAGLWESWKSPSEEVIETCTILTTTANSVVDPIHDRMPVILDPKNYEQWLDLELTRKESLQPLLTPFESEKMNCYPLSSSVNRVKNDSSELISPIEIKP